MLFWNMEKTLVKLKMIKAKIINWLGLSIAFVIFSIPILSFIGIFAAMAAAYIPGFFICTFVFLFSYYLAEKFAK